MTSDIDKNDIAKNIAKYHELWKSVVISLVLALIGAIPKSVRGITLNFDGETIQIVVYFENGPIERDVEEMQNIEAELISHHDYQSDLVCTVVPVSEDLIDKVKNWGWVYLRRED